MFDLIRATVCRHMGIMMDLIHHPLELRETKEMAAIISNGGHLSGLKVCYY